MRWLVEMITKINKRLNASKRRVSNLYNNIIAGIIIRIIRQEQTNEDKDYIHKLIDSLLGLGAEKVILGCTDLANLINKDENIIDSSEVLIDSIKKRMLEK